MTLKMPRSPMKIDAAHPTILIVTDAYSEGWTVRVAGKNDTRSYELLPANHAIRAIPLDAGQHHIIVEYKPAAFRIGAIVSILSAACFLIATCVCVVRNRRQSVS